MSERKYTNLKLQFTHGEVDVCENKRCREGFMFYYK